VAEQMSKGRRYDADFRQAAGVNAPQSKSSTHRKNEQQQNLDYFFAPRTASFAALATRNLTTVLAGILIFCCVFGLKPVRAFLFCFTSLPGRTNSPFLLISLYARALSVSGPADAD